MSATRQIVRGNVRGWSAWAVALVLCAAGPVLAQSAASSPTAAASRTGFSAGVEMKGSATAADVGLPLPPRARPVVDDGQEKSSVTLGLWGGSFGFRLVAAKFETPDSVDRVAAFYREALARYGKVLDCSEPAPKAAQPKDSGMTLNCDGDRAKPGGKVYKVGQDGQFRLVSITPAGTGAQFQLLRIEGPKR